MGCEKAIFFYEPQVSENTARECNTHQHFCSCQTHTNPTAWQPPSVLCRWATTRWWASVMYTSSCHKPDKLLSPVHGFVTSVNMEGVLWCRELNIFCQWENGITLWYIGQNVTTALPPAMHMAVGTCTRLSSHSMTSATCHAVGWLTGQESAVSAMCTHIAATDMTRGSA